MFHRLLQLDALSLDSEVAMILADNLMPILYSWKILSFHRDDIRTCQQLFINLFLLMTKRQTFGMNLYEIKFSGNPSRARLTLFRLLHSGVFENCRLFKLLNLLNLLVFLRNGDQASPYLRILDLSIECQDMFADERYTKRQLLLDVSFSLLLRLVPILKRLFTRARSIDGCPVCGLNDSPHKIKLQCGHVYCHYCYQKNGSRCKECQ